MTTSGATAIPDAATRVRIHGRTYLTADAALDALERYPYLREHEVTADCGPVPVHMKAAPGGGVRWTVWTDGLLVPGDVSPSPELERRPRRLAAVEALLRDIRRAQRPARGAFSLPDGWMRWVDAGGMDSEETDRTVDERAVGPDQVATRLLVLTRRTVHCADGATDTVWVLREQVHLPEPPAEPVRSLSLGAMASTVQVFREEADARAAFAARDDHRLPVVTTAEAAAALGAAPAALRQALSRADEEERPYSVGVGRTHWYVLDRVREWWESRPGHGPGRGHRRGRGRTAPAPEDN
ncbi:hypothetical protein [Streptomyces sp. NPDC056304]|uniref:hypothetical protein n=1 Tax=Streptomyces sp. NPDC056304 TaxID=3345778 RepID=UPI0035D685BE